MHEFPQLSLADVHAGLAYFWDNEKAIRQQMKEAEDLVARLEAAAGSGLLDKFKADDASNDSVPP